MSSVLVVWSQTDRGIVRMDGCIDCGSWDGMGTEHKDERLIRGYLMNYTWFENIQS